MSASTKTRFKTGETCETTGTYKFDEYTDGKTTPPPTAEEREIDLCVEASSQAKKLVGGC